MPRPRIGITCNLDHREFPEEPRQRDRHMLMDAYVGAVHRSGGMALLLPAMEEEIDAAMFLEAVDALIISGGGHDIDPTVFGEERLPFCGPANPRRSAFELALCRSALSQDMPMLGICGGMQVLNVAAGGTLFQDIPAQIEGALPHRPTDERTTYSFHPVETFPSLLEATIGPGPHRVNSSHHQAVKEVAPGLRRSAQSPDGVAEAIESLSHRFVLGVQWHPESMVAYGFGDHLAAEHLLARLVYEARDYALGAGVRRDEPGEEGGQVVSG